jgi:hypothetical protein
VNPTPPAVDNPMLLYGHIFANSGHDTVGRMQTSSIDWPSSHLATVIANDPTFEVGKRSDACNAIR